MSLSEITSAFFKASPTRVISKSAKMSPDKPQFPAMDVRYKAENEYQRKMNVITPPHLGTPQQVTLTTSQFLWENIAMAPIISIFETTTNFNFLSEEECIQNVLYAIY